MSGTAHVTLPAGWIVNENNSDSFVTYPPTLGDFPPTVSMARLTAPKEGVTPVFIDLEIARMEEERASSGLGYRVLETKQKRAFGGLHSEWTYYALVRDPPGVRQSAAVIPIVIAGVDILAWDPGPGGRIFHVAAWAHAENFPTGVSEVLQSLKIEPK